MSLLAGLQPSSERLVKAKSDGSLSSSAATTENSSALMSRLKSKSLEPLTGQAFGGPEAEFVGSYRRFSTLPFDTKEFKAFN